jgi:hypothetical protein
LIVAVLLWGVVLFLVALVTHVLVWRLHKPGAPINALLVLFLGVVVVGLTTLRLAGHAVGSAGLPLLPGLAAYLHVLLFYVSMAFAYIVSYTLIEWESPTIAIVTMLARAGRSGVRKAELLELANGFPLVESRIQSLVRDNTIIAKDGRYTVSPRTFNFFFYRLVLAYGRLLRLERHGG